MEGPRRLYVSARRKIECALRFRSDTLAADPTFCRRTALSAHGGRARRDRAASASPPSLHPSTRFLRIIFLDVGQGDAGAR